MGHENLMIDLPLAIDSHQAAYLTGPDFLQYLGAMLAVGSDQSVRTIDEVNFDHNTSRTVDVGADSSQNMIHHTETRTITQGAHVSVRTRRAELRMEHLTGQPVITKIMFGQQFHKRGNALYPEAGTSECRIMQFIGKAAAQHTCEVVNTALEACHTLARDETPAS